MKGCAQFFWWKSTKWNHRHVCSAKPCADWCTTTLSAIMSELSVKAANPRESYTQCFTKMHRYLSVTQQPRGIALRRQSLVDISSQESKSLTNRYVCCPTNKCIAAPFTVTSMLCADRCMVMATLHAMLVFSPLDRCDGYYARYFKNF